VANYGLLWQRSWLAFNITVQQYGAVAGIRPSVFNGALGLLAVLSLGLGSFEVVRSTRSLHRRLLLAMKPRPPARRLAELATSTTLTQSLVLATDPVVADYLPTIAPQAMLWAPHMYGFAGITPAEDRRRLLTLLYFTNVHLNGSTKEQFESLDAEAALLLFFSVGKKPCRQKSKQHLDTGAALRV